MQRTIFITLICSIFFTLNLFSDDSKITTIDIPIIMTNDVAEESVTGTMDISSTDLEIVQEKSIQTIGLRFKNISTPHGAKILKAYIQFEADEISTQKATLTIYAQNHIRPSLFLNTPFNITSRKKTKQKSIWKPRPWCISGEKSDAQQTSDLSNIVQYMVNKKDWSIGNSIVFIIKGQGKRVAKSYKDSYRAINSVPSLHIEYTLGYAIEKKPISINTASNEIHKSGVIINEILASNTMTNYDLDNKEFSDWSELYNKTASSIDISGYYLSNDVENLKKWKFPNKTVIKPYDYLLVWCDKIDIKLKELHTNFKLNRGEGEVLLLSNAQSLLIDKLIYPKQTSDISYTKHSKKNIFMRPTPNRKNAIGFADFKRIKKPIFSKKSGFFTKKLSLKINQEKDTSIYYTLDGSLPTKNSTAYTKPIYITKTTVVRARSYSPNKFASRITTHTYFIDENITLPVLSLVVDNKYLYSKNIGIATNFDEHWIRAATIEYFTHKKSNFLKDIGLKISGNNTRGYPQKSFAIFCKNRYGSKSIKYPLFTDKPYIKKVKSFTLRNSGTHWGHSLLSEGISHRIVQNNMDIDAQAYQPSILFINGTYWGIYNIRERMNLEYIKSNHHIKSKIDLIENSEHSDDIKEGNIDQLYELIDYVRTHPSDDASYKKVAARFDMNEFINHIITQSYFCNISIQHNVKRWREKRDNGKWRTLLFDLDRGFDKPTDKVLGHLLNQSSTNIFFTYFIQNKKFVHNFASHYFSHLNSTFLPQRVDTFITKAKDDIEPEVNRHFKKWQYDYKGRAVSKKSWQEDIKNLYNFSHKRPDIVRKKLRDAFDLKGHPVLSIKKPKHGSIFVDDIDISEGFRGVYFNNATVTIKAVPDDGYTFKSWSTKETSRTLKMTLHSDIKISAKFVQ